MAVGVATCSDTPIAAVKSGTAPVPAFRGRISLQPVFSKSAQYAAEHADAFGIKFDSVHVVIRGLPDTTVIVKDTTIFFDPTSQDVTLDLDVAVQSDGQRFDAGIGYTFAGTVQYYGHGAVQSHAPNTPPPPQPPLVINYRGPGSNIARLAVSPKTSTISGSQSLPLSVAAFDSAGSSAATPTIVWGTSNASVVTVSSTGVIQGQGRRGSATITATGPNGISDAATISVVLPAASISVVSGAGQSGKAGSVLPNPAVVQVSASDGVAVPGTSVIFGAPAGGGVGTTSVVTDANGRAQTTLRLGSAVGPQAFSATANGFSTAIAATATAADPSAITVVSGNNQSDSSRAALAPLSVRVADPFNNPVGGATVTWARTAGGGALGAATSTTNADGIATNSYTLGDALGAESVTASAGGATATFSFTTGAGGAATIAAVSGGGQTGRVGLPLASPFVVRVADRGGNAVRGAVVTWSAANGTIAASTTTDASGQASATMTIGTVLGTASATARIANGQTVSFAATVQAGLVSQIVFSSQPTGGVANVALPPVRVALRDAGNNPTAAVNSVTLALGANPNGATLSGTLTRAAVSGVATFDDLKLDKVGTGYTLVATSGSLAAITSSAFNTSTGAAASLSIAAGGGQTATVGTAVATPPAVRIVDAANNPIPGVSVTFAPSAGSVVPAGGVVMTDALGVAALTSWNLGTVAGAQTLQVTSAGVSAVTISATATPDAPFAVVLTNKGSLQTSVTAGATLSPQPSIQLVDRFGNATPAGTMQVTATATSGTAAVGGTAQITLGSTTGAGSFSNLSLSGTGSTRIAFTGGAGIIKPDTSGTIAFTAAAPTRLILVPEAPTTFTRAAGAPLNPAPKVKATDASGNAVANAAVQFVVKQGSTQVGGTTLNTDASGLIDAAAVSTPNAAGTYTVTATLVAAPSATTSFTVAVVAGGAANLAINGGNSQTATVNSAVGTAPSVKVTDGSGNAIAGVAVTFAVTGGGGGMSPSNGQVTTNALGVASLDSWTLGTSPGAQTLSVSSTGLTSVTIGATAIPGPPVKLVVTNKGSLQTSLTSGATLSPQPAIQLYDQYGNTSPAGLTVTASLTNGATPLGGTPQITLGSTSGGGAFTNLALGGSGSTRIVFSAGNGVKPDTSGAITVNSIVPTQLVLVPATPTSFRFAAGSPPALPAVKAANDAGVGVAGVPIHIDVSGGTFAASGDATTGKDGTLTPSASLVPTKTGTYTVTATVTSGAIAGRSVTVTLDVTPGAATKLRFNSSPASVVAGTGFSAAVAVTDAYDNVVTDATNSISLTLNAPAGVTGLTFGTPSALAASGIASFSGLSVNKAASASYTLTASATGLSPITSIAFTVSAGAAHHLAFSAQPSNVAAGATMSPVKVQILDANNNLTSSTAPVTLRLHLADVALSNQGPFNAVAGEATFSALSVPTAGTYSLDATTTTGGITSATSNPFTVNTGSVNSLAFVGGHGQPAVVKNNEIFSSGPQIIALDAGGNPVANVTIDATIENPSSSNLAPPGPAEVGWFFSPLRFDAGASATTNSSGIADFSGAKLRGVKQFFRVRFTAQGTSISVAAESELRHGAATVALCTATLPGVVGLSHKLSASPSLRIVDIDTNVVNDENVTVETSAGSFTGAPAATNSTGDVTITSWTVGSTAGTHTLGVHGVSGGCSVKASSPASLKITRHSDGSAVSVLTGLKNGDAVPDLDATVVDAAGLALEDTIFSVSANSATIHDKVINIHALNHAGNNQGKSSFSGLVVDAEAQGGAKLQFTLDGPAPVSGLVTFDSIAVGSTETLNDVGGTTTVVGSISTNTLSPVPTIQLKDHGNHNLVVGVTVNWSFVGCPTGTTFSTATSLTDNAGKATPPSASFAGGAGSCLLRAAVGTLTKDFSLTIR